MYGFGREKNSSTARIHRKKMLRKSPAQFFFLLGLVPWWMEHKHVWVKIVSLLYCCDNSSERIRVWCEIKWRHTAFISFSSSLEWTATIFVTHTSHYQSLYVTKFLFSKNEPHHIQLIIIKLHNFYSQLRNRLLVFSYKELSLALPFHFSTFIHPPTVNDRRSGNESLGFSLLQILLPQGSIQDIYDTQPIVYLLLTKPKSFLND